MTYPRRKYFVSFVINNILSNCIYLSKGSFSKKEFEYKIGKALGADGRIVVVFYKFQGWTFR